MLSQCDLLNNPSFFTDLKRYFYHTLDSLKYLDLLKILFCSIDLSAYADILEVIHLWSYNLAYVGLFLGFSYLYSTDCLLVIVYFGFDFLKGKDYGFFTLCNSLKH
jgi:hypothetical protein